MPGSAPRPIRAQSARRLRPRIPPEGSLQPPGCGGPSAGSRRAADSAWRRSSTLVTSARAWRVATSPSSAAGVTRSHASAGPRTRPLSCAIAASSGAWANDHEVLGLGIEGREVIDHVDDHKPRGHRLHDHRERPAYLQPRPGQGRNRGKRRDRRRTTRRLHQHGAVLAIVVQPQRRDAVVERRRRQLHAVRGPWRSPPVGAALLIGCEAVHDGGLRVARLADRQLAQGQ